MALTNFPSTRGLRLIDTNEQVPWAVMTPEEHSELEYIRLYIFKKGTAGGSETFQCVITTQTVDITSYYASSNTVNLSDWTSETNFIGWCRFDFNKENFNRNQTYYIYLKTANYTNNQDTYYLAGVYDSPESTNATKADSPHHIIEHSLAFEKYFYKYEY